MSVLLLACTFQFMGARRPPGQQDEYAAYAYSRRNEQVKERRTEVLAVGIIGDDDGTNAEDEHGELITVKDLKAADLLQFANASKARSGAFLENIDVFGSLGKNALFTEPFCYWLRYIHRLGVRAAIRKYIAKEK